MDDLFKFYFYSYFFLIGNDLGVMLDFFFCFALFFVLFLENCDNTYEVNAEIADSLKFGSKGKIQHLTFRMKSGVFVWKKIPSLREHLL